MKEYGKGLRGGGNREYRRSPGKCVVTKEFEVFGKFKIRGEEGFGIKSEV